MKNNYKKNEKGFTLAWVTILIAVAGGMIALVFFAQTLKKKSEVLDITQELERYSVAITTFMNKYDSLPGDFPHARRRLPNCSEETFCYEGNGDAIIGKLSDNWMQDEQIENLYYPQIETFSFWKHLSLAEIINSEIVKNDASPETMEWGVTHPIARNIGGYQVIQSKSIPGGKASGVQFILRSRASDRPTSGNNAGAITPELARAVDEKLDDGNSILGRLRASMSEDFCSDKAGLYMESPTKDCSIAYQANY